MGFQSNLTESSRIVWVHFFFLRISGNGFEIQPFLFQYQLLIDGLRYLLAGTVHVPTPTLLRKIKVSGWLSFGDGILFMTTVVDPILGRRSRLSGLGGQNIAFLFHSMIDMDALSNGVFPFAVGVSVAALVSKSSVFPSILLV